MSEEEHSTCRLSRRRVRIGSGPSGLQDVAPPRDRDIADQVIGVDGEWLDDQAALRSCGPIRYSRARGRNSGRSGGGGGSSGGAGHS